MPSISDTIGLRDDHEDELDSPAMAIRNRPWTTFTANVRGEHWMSSAARRMKSNRMQVAWQSDALLPFRAASCSDYEQLAVECAGRAQTTSERSGCLEVAATVGCQRFDASAHAHVCWHRVHIWSDDRQWLLQASRAPRPASRVCAARLGTRALPRVPWAQTIITTSAT